MDKEIRIAICDDEQAQLDMLERCIGSCAYWQERKVTVTRFTQSENLLRRIKSGDRYSYIFLDIHMQKMDGITLYEEILKICEQNVIFVSAYMEYQPKIDGIFPAMLLSKPYTSANLKNLLAAYSARVEARHPFIYNTGHETLVIPIKKIVCVSMRAQMTWMRLLDDNEIPLYGIKLTQMAADFANQGLFKCHKSHIINLRYFVMNTYKEVHLLNDNKILKLPLSRELAVGDRLRNLYLDFSNGGFYV
jgi:DNA-binding LytR/AlgR family response regulator